MFLQRETSTAFAIVPYRGATPAVQELGGFGCKVSEARIRHVNGNVDGSKFAPNADRNVTVLTSSRANEFSLEDDKRNNGVLTRVLLEPPSMLSCCRARTVNSADAS